MKPINILFSIDDGYVEQFKVMLYSMWLNASQKNFAVYILQKNKLEKHDDIMAFCQQLDIAYYPLIIGEKDFEDAPTTDRYPETIYYRLLAHEYLPQELDRILYVDADILCLNDLIPFYEMDLGEYLYAAASHNPDSPDLINKVRLGNYEAESYFNSGVLLMNLVAIRQTVQRQAILDYIQEKSAVLFLPDQDVLNGLYGHQILEVPDEIYNYDARYNALYFAKTAGQFNLNAVMEQTVFLHFCGRDKPWKEDYRGRYAALYKHYMQLTKRLSQAN